MKKAWIGAAALVGVVAAAGASLVPARPGVGQQAGAGDVVAAVDSAEVSSAKAQYITARSALDLAADTFARTSSLGAAQAVPAKQIAADRAAMNQAQAAPLNAEQLLRNFRFDDDDLARSLRDHHTRPLLEITTPLGGTVVFRHAVLGEAVGQTTNLYSVADAATMWPWVDVYERDIARVAPGQKVDFTVLGGGDEDGKPAPVVGKVTWVGSEVDPTTRTTFRSALRDNNQNAGGGYVVRAGESSLVLGVGRRNTTDEIADVVIRSRNGVPTRVRDVAEVEIGHAIRRGGVTANGRGEAVLGLAFMWMGENSRRVTADIARAMEDVRRTLLPGVKVAEAYSRTRLVDAVLRTVERNLVEGGVLVVAVLFAFLGSLRAGLIVASAIPLSMLFAVTVMERAGIAGSLMSLGAIDFGLVVDSSVVMVENCARRLAHDRTGRPRLAIIRDAAVDVRRPTLFGELIIMIVYLPILTLEGVEGKLFRPMALTVVFALSASMLLSLTLMPVLASFGLARHAGERKTLVDRAAHRLFEPILRLGLGHPVATLVAVGLLTVAATFQGFRLGSEFVPRLNDEAVLKKIPGASDVTTEQVTGLPVLRLVLDAEALSRHGVAGEVVLDAVRSVGGIPVGEIIEPTRRFPLVVRLPGEFRDDPASLERILIPTASGQRLPLTQLARFDESEGPATIQRDWGRRRIVVQANVRGRDIGTFVDEAQRRIRENVHLPTGYAVEWGGQFENLRRAEGRLRVVVPIALALILSLLFLSFHSLRDALMIFSGVLFARVGGILGLRWMGLPFSISAGVGFVALAGASMLEGLILVSAIRDRMARGVPKRRAIEEARPARLRPVLMTATVAALGFVPMMLATGIGAEVQKPLATVVVFGMACDTVLTMLVLPVLYLLFGKGPLPDAAIADPGSPA